MRKLIFAISFFIFMTAHALAANGSADESKRPETTQGTSWWNGTPWVDPERGFNWYPPDAPPKQLQKPAHKPKSIKEMTTMEDLQKELSRLKDVAVMKPTPENVRTYLEAQTYVMDKGSMFADVARRVVWTTPSVDYNNRSPVANYALLEKKDIRRVQQEQTMADLSRDYGLMFFFKSDCEYCHAQAPILQLLERNYGMAILPVSLDGKALPQYPHAKADNGISLKVSNGAGIEVTPTLYLVHRQSRQAVLIGTGALALEEIVERIRVLTSTKPGQEF